MLAYDGTTATDSVPTAIRASVIRRPWRRPPVVDVSAEHDRAQRPHQKARAEGGQRQHQRKEFAAAREERFRDVRGVIAEHHEVVHLEEIADGNPGDVAGVRRH